MDTVDTMPCTMLCVRWRCVSLTARRKSSVSSMRPSHLDHSGDGERKRERESILVCTYMELAV